MCYEFLKVTVKLLAIVVVGENDHTFGYGNDVVQWDFLDS